MCKVGHLIHNTLLLTLTCWKSSNTGYYTPSGMWCAGYHTPSGTWCAGYHTPWGTCAGYHTLQKQDVLVTIPHQERDVLVTIPLEEHDVLVTIPLEKHVLVTIPLQEQDVLVTIPLQERDVLVTIPLQEHHFCSIPKGLTTIGSAQMSAEPQLSCNTVCFILRIPIWPKFSIMCRCQVLISISPAAFLYPLYLTDLTGANPTNSAWCAEVLSVNFHIPGCIFVPSVLNRLNRS